MHTVVVYDSKFGNTERIAKAIGRGAGTLGTVLVAATGETRDSLAGRPDLLLIGGPTQKRSISPGLRDVVEALVPGSLQGVLAASFDTRYRGSTWLMGSAAGEAAKRLRKAGARLATAPESFFIGRAGPLEAQTLESGELDRAEAWGRSIAATVARGQEP